MKSEELKETWMTYSKEYIFLYRDKLVKFAKLLGEEYPTSAKNLIEEFDNHFNIKNNVNTGNK